VSEADAADARRALNAIRQTLGSAPDGEEAAIGNQAIAKLNQLFPRLGNTVDSAWAFLALASAYGMAERPDRACEPGRNAKRMASTGEQRASVERLTGLLTCAP
jgi:hypothetical protein